MATDFWHRASQSTQNAGYLFAHDPGLSEITTPTLDGKLLTINFLGSVVCSLHLNLLLDSFPSRPATPKACRSF